MLRSLKAFNAEKHDLDELVALKSFGDQLAGTYSTMGLDEPEWLKEARENVEREAKARSRDLLMKELRETEVRMDGLKTAGERRSELQEKQARLRAKLGIQPAIAA